MKNTFKRKSLLWRIKAPLSELEKYYCEKGNTGMK